MSEILDRRPGFSHGVVKSMFSVDGEHRYYYIAVCRKDRCYFQGYLYNDEAGSIAAERELDEHSCPTPYEESMMPTGKSISQKIWDRLDNLMDEIMKSPDPELKAEARALTWALAMMMQPYYKDETAVKVQLIKRYKMRLGEIEQEPTPGYGGYNPPPAMMDPSATGTAAVKPSVKPARATATLTAAQKAQVDTMKALMSAEQLAKMFKLPLEAVQAYLESGS